MNKMKIDNFDIFTMTTTKGDRTVVAPSSAIVELRYRPLSITRLGAFGGTWLNGQPQLRTETEA